MRGTPREILALLRSEEHAAVAASVALRKLVEAARSAGEDKSRQCAAQESGHRVTTALAANLPAYEDATRALFAHERERFGCVVAAWPRDVRDHTARLAEQAFDAGRDRLN